MLMPNKVCDVIYMEESDFSLGLWAQFSLYYAARHRDTLLLLGYLTHFVCRHRASGGCLTVIIFHI